MACITPESQLTEAEQACCRAMAHQCGDMADSNGHSCCDTVVKHHDPALLKSIPAPLADAQIALSVPPSDTLIPSSAIQAFTRQPLRHPPPGFASPSIEILRI